MNNIVCFWVEPTDRLQRWLRRFRWEGACPAMEGNLPYHDASIRIEDGPLRKTPEGYIAEESAPRDDSRWPICCACGEPFHDDDVWQVWQDVIYRRVDTGEEWGQRDLPAGALYDASWLGDFAKGDDGLHLVCIIPSHHEWLVDGPASNAPHDTRGWQRSGTPPAITVTPSVHLPGVYHGWLRDGVLIEV